MYRGETSAVKKISSGIGLLTVLVIVLLAAGSCVEEQSGQLPPVEVREYQGQKLSSVNDFRENSIKGPQNIDVKDYKLSITGLVKNPKEYTYAEVVQNHKGYEKVVTLNCVEGWSATVLWKGLLVRDLLAEVEPLPETKVIIFHAYDGYTTSLPIEYVMDNDILMAYHMNGSFLLPERGFPFQLVAESKWGYKWIRWITKIELSDDIHHRGYWEQRGYSNTADLEERFFFDD